MNRIYFFLHEKHLAGYKNDTGMFLFSAMLQVLLPCYIAKQLQNKQGSKIHSVRSNVLHNNVHTIYLSIYLSIL